MQTRLKTLLLFAAVALLSGCMHEAAEHREVVGKLDAINATLTNKLETPFRWAFANKNEITMAVMQWSNEKVEAYKNTEEIAPEMAEKLQQYEALNNQLMQMRMSMMRSRSMRGAPGIPSGPPGPETPPTDSEFETLSKKVAEARTPVAAVLDRREHLAGQYRNKFSADQLIAEYAKGRYELVVDSNERVLYRSSGEVPDITEGVLMLFREKSK